MTNTDPMDITTTDGHATTNSQDSAVAHSGPNTTDTRTDPGQWARQRAALDKAIGIFQRMH